jgi:hypothetical protein
MCLNLCGLPTPPSEAELTEAFLTTVPKRFEFWSGETSVWNLTDGEAEPTDVELVRYPFRCRMLFDDEQVHPVQVSYGDRDYSATITVHGRRLEDWLAALSQEQLPGYRYLHSPARMDEYMTAAAASLSRHWDRMAEPDADLIAAAAQAANDLARHERLDQAQVAFAAKNYSRVVELLGPLEGELFRSDQKRLDRALRKTRKKP